MIGYKNSTSSNDEQKNTEPKMSLRKRTGFVNARSYSSQHEVDGQSVRKEKKRQRERDKGGRARKRKLDEIQATLSLDNPTKCRDRLYDLSDWATGHFEAG